MPELPEVETIVRGLREPLVGHKIKNVIVFNPLIVKHPPKTFQKNLIGKTICSVARHGKAIFWILNSGPCLRLHLGMTGALLIRNKNEPVDPYVRVLFELDHLSINICFRDIRQFGNLSLTKAPSVKTWGPDAWDASPDDLRRALSEKSGLVKNTLLNQCVIAGLGNIYVDEVLFSVGVHPKSQLEKLPKNTISRIVENTKHILGAAIKAGGTTFRDYVDSNGKRGTFKTHLKVYGQNGKPCLVCGTPIRKIVAAGRGTHFCSKCQRLKG